MLPVLSREVVEGKQRVAILDQALDSLVVFDAPGFDEGVERGECILLGLGHPNLLERTLGLRLLALGPFAGLILGNRTSFSRAVSSTGYSLPIVVAALEIDMLPLRMKDFTPVFGVIYFDRHPVETAGSISQARSVTLTLLTPSTGSVGKAAGLFKRSRSKSRRDTGVSAVSESKRCSANDCAISSRNGRPPFDTISNMPLTGSQQIAASITGHLVLRFGSSRSNSMLHSGRPST